MKGCWSIYSGVEFGSEMAWEEPTTFQTTTGVNRLMALTYMDGAETESKSLCMATSGLLAQVRSTQMIQSTHG